MHGSRKKIPDDGSFWFPEGKKYRLRKTRVSVSAADQVNNFVEITRNNLCRRPIRPRQYLKISLNSDTLSSNSQVRK
jgi:hypothetical protein